jgi:DNA-binding response OmpR family regulator
MKKKGKILITDDNPKNIQLLANILHPQNYEVEVALSSQETLNWLKDETFDLLLLDVMMPIMNGFQVCQQIRKNNRHDNMPIIFISAKTDKQSIINGFEVGGQDYVTKPFNEEELLARVSTHISLKNSNEELMKMNLQLEDIVAERTQELSRVNNRLVEIDNARNQFLSFIGQEVRTPILLMEKSLKAIKMSAESSNLAGLLTELNHSFTKLKRITSLTNKMTQIHSKNCDDCIQETDLYGLIDMILTNLDTQIEDKDLVMNMNIEEQTIVYANYELLKESFSALLALICSRSVNNAMVRIDYKENGQLSELVIMCELGDSEGDFYEELGLYSSYSELSMNFQKGVFKYENKIENEYAFNWRFYQK